MTNPIIASDKNHWYYPDGTPCHEVPNKSKPGEVRSTTLRDAKALGLFPSVTNFLSIISRPGLEIYKQNQILLSAATSPYDQSNADAWAKQVLEDAQKHAKEASELGTAIHGAIEKRLKGEATKEYFDYVDPVLQEMYCREMLINPKAEHSFAHPIGFGGKIDYHNDEFLVDFKTKAFTESKGLAYDENLFQLAAYRFGLQLPHLRCFNIYISTTVKGLYHFHEWKEDELKWGLQVSLKALELWKLMKL